MGYVSSGSGVENALAITALKQGLFAAETAVNVTAGAAEYTIFEIEVDLTDFDYIIVRGKGYDNTYKARFYVDTTMEHAWNATATTEKIDVSAYTGLTTLSFRHVQWSGGATTGTWYCCFGF